MKHNVQVVQCSPNRCSDCPNQSDLKCKNLVIGNQSVEESTILVEKNRGLLHVRFSGEPVLTEPPWFVEGWESVFIGKDSDVFCNVLDIVDVYRVEPYVSLFYVDSDTDIRHLHLPMVGTSLEYSLLNDLLNEYRRTIEPIQKSRKKLTINLEYVVTWVSERIKEQRSIDDRGSDLYRPFGNDQRDGRKIRHRLFDRIEEIASP